MIATEEIRESRPLCESSMSVLKTELLAVWKQQFDSRDLYWNRVSQGPGSQYLKDRCDDSGSPSLTVLSKYKTYAAEALHSLHDRGVHNWIQTPYYAGQSQAKGNTPQMLEWLCSTNATINRKLSWEQGRLCVGVYQKIVFILCEVGGSRIVIWAVLLCCVVLCDVVMCGSGLSFHKTRRHIDCYQQVVVVSSTSNWPHHISYQKNEH